MKKFTYFYEPYFPGSDEGPVFVTDPECKITIMRRRISVLSTFICLILISCQQNDRQTVSRMLSVSIEPLRYLTEQITDNDFEINVLVPPGSGPETYEPTPSQMRQLARSEAYIAIGLIDFEKNLETAIRSNMPEVEIIAVSENVPLLAGECNHAEESHPPHGHGYDPHIWTSPSRLKTMARTVLDHLSVGNPDSVRYERNYERFSARMDSLDSVLDSIVSGGKTAGFLIFHPALGYFADDYGLRQIALENEGKEPSAEHLRSLIDSARQAGIDKVLYQKQFSRNTVNALAAELGIEAVAVDPLGYDIPGNLLQIANLIARP